MASVPAQSLECGICQELYNEPKQLSCTHTFCQKCLADLLDFSIKEDNLTCPVCRQTTQVLDGDVSKLQTNFPIKSLVEDVKAAKEICTICDHDMRCPAVVYCQTCGDYMCSTCLDAHGKWKKNRGHEVVDSDAIKSGKVKVKQLCKKHPQEEMEWVCSTCKVSICFRCRMLYHNGPIHEVEEVAEFQKALKDEATTLQQEAEDTVQIIKDHIRVAEEENEKSSSILDERVADVIRAYDDFIKKLTKQKDELVKKLQKYKEEMTGHLKDREKCDVKLLNGISSARDLVAKGVAGFLEGESLAVHQRLCAELRELISRVDCNDQIPRGITEQAENIKFTRCHIQHELKLGDLNLPGMDGEAASANLPRALKPTPSDKAWNLKKINSLSTLGAGVSDMAPRPDGRMALCYKKGGVDLFTVDGIQDTMLEKTTIQLLRFLSDGRCAVIDAYAKFSLYSPKLEKVPSPEVHAKGCYWIYVGKVNEILIYHHDYDDETPNFQDIWRRVLSMYRPCSREFVRYLERNTVCDNAISQMSHRPYYVSACGCCTKVVNEEFKEINEVEVEGPRAFPVILDDDNILIGWANEGYATVDLYTYDLRYIRTVLQGFKLYGDDFLMKAFSTGEIAICDSRQIHVFQMQCAQ